MNEEDVQKRGSELSRGQDAKRILEEPLLAEALEEIKGKAIFSWVTSGPGETEHREQLYFLLKGQEAFVTLLKTHIETGKFASNQLEAFEAKKSEERESES